MFSTSGAGSPAGYAKNKLGNKLSVSGFAAMSSGIYSNYSFVELLYRDSVGDGGGGLFRVDTADGSTPADGGIVYVDAAGNRLKRVFDGEIKAEWFGSTLSTAVTQLAVDGGANNECVRIKGQPAYSHLVNWKGREHTTDNLPHVLQSMPITGGNLNARMTVENGILYICGYSAAKVHMFSLADPRNPTLISSFDTAAQPRHIEVVGRHAFVCCHAADKIEIYDTSNPSAVGLVGEIPTGLNPKMFDLQGNEIYVVCYGSDTLEKYKFTLPKDGAFNYYKVGEVTVANGPLCCAFNGEGLVAVCGLDTATVNLVGSETLNLIDATAVGGASHGTCVWFNKTQLLVTDATNNQLHSIDYTAVGTPVINSSIPVVTSPEQIEIVGNRCYIPSLTVPPDASSFSAIDLTDVKNPVEYKQVPLTIVGGGFTAYYQDGNTGYLYINGHFAPYNLEVIEVVPGKSGRFDKNCKEVLSARDASFGSLEAKHTTIYHKNSTKVTGYTCTITDHYIRVGAGAPITLPNPNLMRDKQLTIKNVSATLRSAINNAFSGDAPSALNPGESITVVATEFGGGYQWDLKEDSKDSRFRKYRTVTSSTTLLISDPEIIRAGSGTTFTINLPDPSTMDGRIFIIKNVHGSTSITIANAFAGYSGTLAAGEFIKVLAADFGGFQWDRIG